MQNKIKINSADSAQLAHEDTMRTPAHVMSAEHQSQQPGPVRAGGPSVPRPWSFAAVHLQIIVAVWLSAPLIREGGTRPPSRPTADRSDTGGDSQVLTTVAERRQIATKRQGDQT